MNIGDLIKREHNFFVKVKKGRSLAGIFVVIAEKKLFATRRIELLMQR